MRSVLVCICLMACLVSSYSKRRGPQRAWRPVALPQKQGSSLQQWGSTSSGAHLAEGKGSSPGQMKTVKVTCLPDHMVIEMDADLLELGFPVDVEDLRLGGREETGDSCAAVPTGHGKYEIAAALTDCGTEHRILDEFVVYHNTLEYSPRPFGDGLIRTSHASFPIQCNYKRKYELDAIAVMPTWTPFKSSKEDEEQLIFSLRVMTDDWAFERSNMDYFLGDLINIEASVMSYHHQPMKVFVDKCVATSSPDVNSVPRYSIIEQQGCLVDGFLTGSKSQFLPRVQPDKLRFQLEAFRFSQDEQGEIHITCTMRAEAEDESRACSFIDNRWRSADGDDAACDGCLVNSNPAKMSSKHKSGTSSRPGSSYGGRKVSHFNQLKPRSGGSKGGEKSKVSKDKQVGPFKTHRKTALSQTQSNSVDKAIKTVKASAQFSGPKIIDSSKSAFPRSARQNKISSPKGLAEVLQLLQKPLLTPPSAGDTQQSIFPEVSDKGLMVSGVNDAASQGLTAGNEKDD